MCTHLFLAGWRCEQWYYGNHDSSEPTEQNGEVEVMDTAQHCRCRVHNATSGRSKAKLQHHPTHTHHQTHHQAPECTLKNPNTHIQIALHAFQSWRAELPAAKSISQIPGAALCHTWVCLVRDTLTFLPWRSVIIVSVKSTPSVSICARLSDENVICAVQLTTH